LFETLNSSPKKEICPTTPDRVELADETEQFTLLGRRQSCELFADDRSVPEEPTEQFAPRIGEMEPVARPCGSAAPARPLHLVQQL
jgi:hypothetical protein